MDIKAHQTVVCLQHKPMGDGDMGFGGEGGWESVSGISLHQSKGQGGKGGHREEFEKPVRRHHHVQNRLGPHGEGLGGPVGAPKLGKSSELLMSGAFSLEVAQGASLTTKPLEEPRGSSAEEDALEGFM